MEHLTTEKTDTTVRDGEGSRRGRAIQRVKSLAALPSLLTIGNGISGFAAIILLTKAYAHLQLKHMMPAYAEMYSACLCIGLAMIFDALDGRVARMTGTDGRFGAELDSLCDAISFVLVPAFLIRVFGEAVFGVGIDEAPGVAIRLLWAVGALYIACGVIRLARFNVETDDEDDHRAFWGLPTPAAAGAIVSLFLFSWYFRDRTENRLAFPGTMTVLLPLLGALFALLMVSRIRYIHVFNRLVTGRKPLRFMVLVLALAAGLAILGFDALPLVVAVILLAYALSGPIGVGVTLARRRARLPRRLAESARRRQAKREG